MRRQVVEWVRLAVSILTERLEKHEKIIALSKVMEELKNEKHAPQEIPDDENFVEFVEGMCKSLTTNVGNIINQNEKTKILLEQEMAERTKLFAQSYQFHMECQKKLEESGFGVP